MSKKDDFASLLVHPAFLQLEAWAQDQSEISMRSIDSISAKDLSVNHVCEERGYRKGLKKIFEHARFVRTNG